MTKLVSLLIFLSSFNALAQNLIKVAVIDTGLKLEYNQFAHLCPKDHKDFTGEGLNDINGHGTNVTGLIVNNAQSNNYCIVIIKAYRTRSKIEAFLRKSQFQSYLTEALEYAYEINVNVINLSGGGGFPIPEEKDIVEKILDAKIVLNVAVGNGDMNLDDQCNYYPACYDKRIYVIGNLGSLSNYGTIVDLFYNGDNKIAFGQKMSGSSQSTAIFTGKLLKNLDLIRKTK